MHFSSSNVELVKISLKHFAQKFLHFHVDLFRLIGCVNIMGSESKTCTGSAETEEWER